MLIEVQHWSGAGNRFVIIDNRKNNIDQPLNTLVTGLCRRKTLPDAEGLLVLIESDRNQSKCTYEFYNPDGSTGAMCGNGARCAIEHVVSTDQFNRNEIHLILNNRSYTAKVLDNDRVALRLPVYQELRLIDLWTYVNVGNHHVVIDARDLVRSIDEFHQFDLIQFAKENLDVYREKVGIPSLNLNIAYSIENQPRIYLRTYENGVFAETQACGTGALSTAIAFWTRNIINTSKIELIPTSQRSLNVHLELDNQGENIVGMILEGDAREDAPASQFNTTSLHYE